MYRAIDVARYIIYYLSLTDRFVTTLKIQKYLYFIQAYFMVEKHQPCFEEKIYACGFGTIIEEVWQDLKHFGSSTALIDYDAVFSKDWISPTDQKLIEEVVEEFYPYSASGLTDLQRAQLPWRNAYHKDHYCEPICEITPQALYDYFSEDDVDNGASS